MKVRMPSHIIGRIRTYLDNRKYRRDEHHSLTQLQEAVTIFDKFDGMEDKEIVRHFHSRNKKIEGIKTLRLMLDYNLSDSKSLYERLAEEIDREAPKVDVNLLKQMLDLHVKLHKGHNTRSNIDFELFHRDFDYTFTAIPDKGFYTDDELATISSMDITTRWLYSQCRDHFVARADNQTLGDILAEALKR